MDEMNNDVLTTALERFDQAREHESENRQLAEEDFQFVAGDGQWDYDIRKEREQDGRPCLTINTAPVYISQVMGDARQNKPAIKVNAVDDKSDVDTAELLEGLIRHIESNSDADVAYLGALQHACEGGFGHWRVITEYADNESFDQDIKIKRILNPFSVYWDNNSTHPCKADAEWCFVTEWMTTEAFDRKYPNADGVRDWEAPQVRRAFGAWLDADDRVRVAEYWCKKHTPITLSLLPDGSTIEGKIEGAIATRKSDRVEIHRYVLSGDKVLSGPERWVGKHIPIVSVFGPEEYIDGRVRYRSMLRHAKDPMRMYNYWQTAITEKIALAPKSPFVGTVENFRGLEHIWNRANTLNVPFLPYNPDPTAPGAKPDRSRPADVNVAEITQANQSIEDIKRTFGIFDASLGAQGNETSGRAILARQREGDTATFAWIDNLSRGIEHTGRILIDLIPKIFDSQRAVRILGEDDSHDIVTVNELQVTDPMTGQFEVLNDLSVGKYDVRVTVGPSYSTKRMEAAESMMQFIQAFPAAAPVTGDLVAKSMDWPGAEDIAERLKKMLPPELQGDDLSPEEQEQRAIAQQQQQEQMAKEQAMQEQSYRLEIEKGMAEVRAKMAKAAKDIADAEAQDIENAATEAGIAELLNG